MGYFLEAERTIYDKVSQESYKMHTIDKAAQIVLSLLKQYGIKKIVVSPGTTNVPISMTVQHDPWFEVYSVVDERSAAYFATGLAYESGEPVVISCTGATASRNYLPGLTEAYYRNLPIIALTSQHHVSDVGDLTPQVTDRSVSQNDIKKISVMLPFIKDEEDSERCEILMNRALIKATTGGNGPVHVNLLVDATYPFIEVSDGFVAKKIAYFESDTLAESADEIRKELVNKKVGIFIGSHRKFTKSELTSIENFVDSYDIAVFADHTSSYTGKNKVLSARLYGACSSQEKPDILIDMGGITGDYEAYSGLDGVAVWRLSEDGEIHNRFHRITKLFNMKESIFFDSLSHKRKSSHTFYKAIKNELSRFFVPDMPLSNTYISGKLAEKIPKNSNLHLGILNCLRNMNFYELDDTISPSSNVGGFGIDGSVSTLIGQSMGDKNKLYFGLTGDLAFFYDMNALGIRHIGKNIRLLVINNNQGVEFRLNTTLESQWDDKTDDLIAAKGHNGSVKMWAESMGFKYMTASKLEDFDSQIDDFCSSDISHFDSPVVYEVFTEVIDEQAGYDLMRLQQ